MSRRRLAAIVGCTTLLAWAVAGFAATKFIGGSDADVDDLIAYATQPEEADFVDLMAVSSSGVRSQLSLTGGESEVSPSWSPEHDLLAYATTLDPGIWLMRADGTDPRRLPDAGSDPVEFLPSGDEVAFYQSGGIVALELATDRTRVLVEQLPGSPESIAFSPDGRSMYATGFGFESALYRYDLESGERAVVPTPTGKTSAVDVSPKGDLIAFVAVGSSFQERQAYIANIDGSDARRAPAGAGAYDVAFSRNGQDLAIVRDDDRIAVVPVDGGSARVFRAGPVAGDLDW